MRDIHVYIIVSYMPVLVYLYSITFMVCYLTNNITCT